jgi:hypothetical protein
LACRVYAPRTVDFSTQAIINNDLIVPRIAIYKHTFTCAQGSSEVKSYVLQILIWESHGAAYILCIISAGRASPIELYNRAEREREYTLFMLMSGPCWPI